mmetsp:Transcript_7168/g.19194  ORF Transcript_7168/g.19194 Transcript_7168/m.19194 type:complete len:516 (-) Transcript_7168:1445-2992(-)|eukprot:CAMPEP_0185831388 /NCGR_PEP_ID=MMETSP1353-20130828/1458_1 /TAXON_ID=1077150 /ORGANISM="Erythrolobus australicus, Strain CCMP3124" /LENGTH=515 /DNA_ID=CAMNT_0028529441 /DNA_START=1382 /DNA_END=2929 /DNA_ORIENTATION=-
MAFVCAGFTTNRALGARGGVRLSRAVPRSADRRLRPCVRDCRASAEQWTPASWRDKVSAYQRSIPAGDDAQSSVRVPQLPVGDALEAVEKRLSALPVLVSPGEIVALRAALANAAAGRAFVVHAGDDRAGDSVSGESRGKSIEGTFRLLVAQVILLTYLSGVPTVKIGFVERSVTMADCLSDDECVTDGSQLAAASAQTYSDWALALNMLRAIAKSTGSMMEWVDLIYTQIQAGVDSSGKESIEEFEKSFPKAQPLLDLVTRVDDALRFVTGCGIDVSNDVFREPEFFTSMELSSLWYEQAFTRTDTTYGSSSNEFFTTSAHILVASASDLIRDGSPFLEFARGIYNPIAIRVGARTPPHELARAVETLNPRNLPGRVVITAGMGAREIWQYLPGVIAAVRSCKSPNVVWTCDPICANIVELKGGLRTSPFGLITAEIDAFFSICKAEEVIPGGLHLNMTGEQVSEVFGGAFTASNETSAPPSDGAKTSQNPRLNGLQALEIAYEAGQRLRQMRG